MKHENDLVEELDVMLRPPQNLAPTWLIATLSLVYAFGACILIFNLTTSGW